MAKVKVRTRFDILDSIDKRKAFPRQFSQKLGRMIVTEMLRAIARGQSPIRNFGRFKAYKKQRSDDNRGYPDGHPGKRVRPVNLELTGEMLSYLDFGVHPRRQGSMSLGFSDQSPSDVRLRARVHNSGEHPHIPQRKFVPDKPGEQFNVLITRRIKQFYREQWNRTIDKTNK